MFRSEQSVNRALKLARADLEFAPVKPHWADTEGKSETAANTVETVVINGKRAVCVLSDCKSKYLIKYADRSPPELWDAEVVDNGDRFIRPRPYFDN